MKKNYSVIILLIALLGILVSCTYNLDITSYKVVYNYNDGTEVPKETSYVMLDGSSAPYITLNRDGYSFAGWYTEKECTNKYDFTSVLSENITLYAKWEQLFSVTFNLNNGNGIVPKAVKQTTVGQSIEIPSEIEDSGNKGMVINSWNTKADGTGTEVKLGSDYIPTENVTLYAIGHSWVQLWADGPKWAEFNIGSTITSYAQANSTSATSSEKYDISYVGDYYQWGVTESKQTETITTPASTDQTTGIQGSDNDTAKAVWGSAWMMADKNDFCKLYNKDTDGNTALGTALTTWTFCDGNTTQYVEGCTLKGWKVSGIGTEYESNSIFLPVAGTWSDGTFSNQGRSAIYWTSSYSQYFDYGTPELQYHGAFMLSFPMDNCMPNYISSNNISNNYSVRAILCE